MKIIAATLEARPGHKPSSGPFMPGPRQGLLTLAPVIEKILRQLGLRLTRHLGRQPAGHRRERPDCRSSLVFRRPGAPWSEEGRLRPRPAGKGQSGRFVSVDP